MAGKIVGRHARSIRRVLRKLLRRKVRPIVASKIIGRSGLRIVVAVTTVSMVLFGFAIVACIMLVSQLSRLRYWRQSKVVQ